MILLDFTFDTLAPVGALRARSNGSSVYTPKPYREYKAALSSFIKQKYAYLRKYVPATKTKERRAFLKQKYMMTLAIFGKNARGDDDNFLKCVKDAITQAGVIADDCQFAGETVFPFVDSNHPRIEVRMYRVPDSLTETKRQVLFCELQACMERALIDG